MTHGNDECNRLKRAFVEYKKKMSGTILVQRQTNWKKIKKKTDKVFVFIPT